MKIYTKQGDKGYTRLVDGSKVEKDDSRILVIGELDELNSLLGLLSCHLHKADTKEMIDELQRSIFKISCFQMNDTFSMEISLKWIENEIDSIQSILPPQQAFLLPGGCMAAAQAHVCRSVCRRVECHLYTLSKHYPIHDSILKYLNRMSDFLFVLARKINLENAIDEKIWQNTCK